MLRSTSMRLHLVLLFPLISAPLSAAEPMPRTVADGAKLIEVYSDERFFEGPTWDPAGKKLHFTAFARGNTQVLRLDAPGKVSVFADKTEGVNGTCLGLDGRLLGAQVDGHRIVAYDFKTRKMEVLLHDPQLNQPNDLCQAPGGDIYFTDPDFKHI